ncbi:MAG TPA: hypothetical protein VMF07_14990 [Solirubrobacteraceae bacterium]|nr:hypothetical protein [Solirubrobacteraceae bacterium]
MSRFFEPPPNPWPAQAARANPPPWTGRPQGVPLGALVSDLLLARSDRAAVYVDYLDAYPEGFELEVRASTRVAYDALAREGDRSGPDPFGRHWPMVGERSDVLPAQLLRVGVRFADGRAVTSIGGHDRPVGGPVMDALAGGGHRGGEESRFHQGYWISPLPPPGPVSIVCEWPAVDIPVACRQIDGQAVLDAAERARAMFGDPHHVRNDGRTWPLGTGADVAWINEGVAAGPTITSAIPPVFESYCTLEVPPNYTDELARHEQAVIELLAKETPDHPWWLGYLDTGASDVVFPYAPRTTIYYGYGYVLVEAGPQQATTWREEPFNWTLPELLFPADRSWLVSTMWDDAWSSIGGSRKLIDAVVSHPTLGPAARRISPSENVN